MDKVITRLTIVLVTIYFIVSYIFAQFGLDIMTSSYVLLFELCAVAYTFCSGSFHCKYMRSTAISILIVDTISHTDYYFDYIPVSVYNIIPIFILALGISISMFIAFRHFYLVNKIRRKRNARE